MYKNFQGQISFIKFILIPNWYEPRSLVVWPKPGTYLCIAPGFWSTTRQHASVQIFAGCNIHVIYFEWEKKTQLKFEEVWKCCHV